MTPASLGDVLGDLTGTVDLVCTSPPYACDVGNMDKAKWGAGGDLCPTGDAELLDRQGQPRPRPRRRLRAGHGRDLRRLLRAAPPRRDPRHRHQAHPAPRSHPRPGRAHQRPRPTGRVHLPRPTSSPSTPRSATASSSPARRSGRPPRSARPAAAANPPISSVHEDLLGLPPTGGARCPLSSPCRSGPPPSAPPAPSAPGATSTSRAPTRPRCSPPSRPGPSPPTPSPATSCVDPMCGVGTTLVEAVHQGRDAIGIEYEPQWAELAEANLALAASQGATGHGEVICGDGRSPRQPRRPRRPRARRPGAHLAALRAVAARSGHRHPRRRRPQSSTTGTRPTRPTWPTSAWPACSTPCAPCCAAPPRLLRPDGIVAMTVRPWWRDGQLVDLPGALATVGEEAGLVLYERNVALLAALRDDTLVPQVVVLRPRTGPQGPRRAACPVRSRRTRTCWSGASTPRR